MDDDRPRSGGLARLAERARATDPLFDTERRALQLWSATRERWKVLRSDLGLSQAEVAERMGSSQSVVSELEAGETDPHLSTLRRYLAALEHTLMIQEVPAGEPSTLTTAYDLHSVSVGSFSTFVGTHSALVSVDDIHPVFLSQGWSGSKVHIIVRDDVARVVKPSA